MGLRNADEASILADEAISTGAHKQQFITGFYVGIIIEIPVPAHVLPCLVSRMSRDRNLYNDAYRALSNNFGDDPTVAMTLIPYFFSRGDSDRAMELERLLQEGLGVRDGALLALMSRTALGLRNADEASILADEAISTGAHKQQFITGFYVGIIIEIPVPAHVLPCLVSRMSRDRNLYNDAYRALSNNFGDDPTVAMTLIPYFFSRGDSDRAMELERLLQEGLGVRDGALLALMSRTALGLRNADEASILADEAISTEPTLESAYWAAIDAHVALNHHSFAVMTAKSLEDQFGKSIERERFENSSMYGNLVKSSQYKQWQAEKRLQ